jgi:hypothetical protein
MGFHGTSQPGVMGHFRQGTKLCFHFRQEQDSAYIHTYMYVVTWCEAMRTKPWLCRQELILDKYVAGLLENVSRIIEHAKKNFFSHFKIRISRFTIHFMYSLCAVS